MKKIDRDTARQITEAIAHAEREIEKALYMCEDAEMPKAILKRLDRCIAHLEETKWAVSMREER